MQASRLLGMVIGMAGLFLFALAGNGQDSLDIAKPGESLRLSLLRTPQVQKELKLRPEQIGKITKIVEQTKVAKKQVESAHGKDKEKGKPKAVDPISKERERITRESLNADLAIVERESDRLLNGVLNKAQRTRLTQIVLRVQGPWAFLTPDLIDALGLAPEQVESIREILTGLKSAQEAFKESRKKQFDRLKGSGDFELEKIRKDQQKGQMRAGAYKLNTQTMPLIGRILTRSQRENYKRLLGDEFELGTLTGPNGQPLIDESASLAQSLLRQKAVQEELKLTAAQKEGLARGESPEDVLKPEQVERLEEIELQSEGPAALTRPDVARTLRLSEDQITVIWNILDQLTGANEQVKAALKNAQAGLDPPKDEARKEQEKAQFRTASSRLRGEAVRRIEAVLTRAQRNKFTRMLGEPFDFSRIRPEPPQPPR